MLEIEAISSMGFREKGYRRLISKFSPWIATRRDRHASGLIQGINEVLQSVDSVARGSCVWFHAASVGELECLWPLIEDYYRANEGKTIIVTVFSVSAEKALNRLAQELTSERVLHSRVFWGFSPIEGGWYECLKKVSPAVFITARYEAWPELWVAASKFNVPIVILGARSRSSLNWAKRITRLLGISLPELLFLPYHADQAQQLLTDFPAVVSETVKDPRWERVLRRAQVGNPRAIELQSLCSEMPRPWGILGSAWVADLKQWAQSLDQVQGTLWLVPHRLEGLELEEVKTIMRGHGFKVHETMGLDNTSHLELGQRNCVLVDEYGVLSDLYSQMDWAYVGGGFGEGIHSTIEPAVHGLPIAVGPEGVEQFEETQELSRSGQLTVLRESHQLLSWLRKAQSNFISEEKSQWKKSLREKIGASQQIRSLIEDRYQRSE